MVYEPPSTLAIQHDNYCPFIDDIEKQRLRWNRCDEEFFSKGACHILAHTFLQKYAKHGFNSVIIKPTHGNRGLHVFASNGKIAFDWQGFKKHNELIADYFDNYYKRDSGWQAIVMNSTDCLIGPQFCREHNSRMVCQYFQNPIPRAIKYLTQLEGLGLAALATDRW